MRFGKDAKGLPLMSNDDLPVVIGVRNTSGAARTAGEVVIWQTAATWTRAAYTASRVLNRVIAAASEKTIAGRDVTTTTVRHDNRAAGMLLTDMAIDGEGLMLKFGNTPASEATIRQAGQSSVSLSAIELRVAVGAAESIAVGGRLSTSETEGRAGPAPVGAGDIQPGAQVGFAREAVANTGAAQTTTIEAFICVQ